MELGAFLTGEKLSNNMDAAKPFEFKFPNKVTELKLCPDWVYSTDESIFQKVLPKETVVHKHGRVCTSVKN